VPSQQLSAYPNTRRPPNPDQLSNQSLPPATAVQCQGGLLAGCGPLSTILSKKLCTTIACVDTATDNNNCGGCGTVVSYLPLPLPQPNAVRRSSPVYYLLTTTNLPGYKCAVNTTCTAGHCVPNTPPACPTGSTRCGGVCINTSNDLYNCGSCGFSVRSDRPDRMNAAFVAID